MKRDHLALELDKVLELLAAETTCADAAEAARALTPSPYLAVAQERLNETEAAWRLMAGFGSPSFGHLQNTVNALRRADAGAVLAPRELLQIAETLRVIRSLHDWRDHCAGIETCLDDRFDTLTPNKYLEEKITTTLVSEDTIADNASPLLADIRRKMRAAAQRVRDQLDKLVRSPAHQKFLQDPIVTIRSGRFVVPVKAEYRGEIPGLVHDTSASGSTVFVEPMGSVEANNEIRVLESKEKAEIERILAELSAEAGTFADQIIANYELLVELNLIFAKARLAYNMRSTMPKLTEDGHILLRRARHPLIDPKKVVAIDVELGAKFDTLVVTGPNTGGKTVSLKTIGLLSLMAMCGLMPPVDDGSSLSVFPHVMADIGDEQSIEQSLSTFSAHMTNIVRILKTTDTRSLVLLDELGAGTDPVEGAALAIAILEQLRTQGARIAATTHYAELKAYAIRTDGVENGSCEFDVATLRPTYRLLVGIPGRSNAFAISKR
ncbi:MAG: endonuclease MutS2, partial [Clostridia bacterium]|nr:endonuclease MutS2 [Clostridia bacterium]